MKNSKNRKVILFLLLTLVFLVGCGWKNPKNSIPMKKVSYFGFNMQVPEVYEEISVESDRVILKNASNDDKLFIIEFKKSDGYTIEKIKDFAQSAFSKYSSTNVTGKYEIVGTFKNDDGFNHVFGIRETQDKIIAVETKTKDKFVDMKFLISNMNQIE